MAMSLSLEIRYLVKAYSNTHRQGGKRNIFLFSTPRSGSTWLMEIIASQRGMKFYDEPFNIRRDNVARAGRFTAWEQLMPEGCDTEAVLAYLEDLGANRVRVMNPPPFRKNHHFISDRIVFKIHELEHLIDEIVSRCHGSAVYLLRHPIATTLSRHQLPRLRLFVESAYYRDKLLEPHQVLEAERLLKSGSAFQQGVLSWCLENLIPLKKAEERHWIFLTYEELVLNMRKCCHFLAEQLELPDVGRMLRRGGEPAINISMSTGETQRLVSAPDNLSRRVGLVKKWQARASEGHAHQAQEILSLFGIDAYKCRQLLADERFLKFEDTARLLSESDGREA